MAASDISVTVERDLAFVVLRGEHEAFTAHKLESKIQALLDEGISVAVDLRPTMFIDSTVMSVLLASRRKAGERGLRFLLVLGDATGWPVRRLLEVTGLDATFEIVE